MMRAALTSLRAWGNWKQSSLLSALAVCEDSVTARRVVEFCRELSCELGSECKLSQQLWLFNELRITKLREIAAGEAAVAGMVILSAHDGQQLPAEVQGWLEMWVRLRPPDSGVLFVLLDSSPPNAPVPLETYLEQVAKAENLEVLVQADEAYHDRWHRASAV